ncbi:MAG: hypothetical protein ACJ790_22580 [Myxococcaceae bacterium]
MSSRALSVAAVLVAAGAFASTPPEVNGYVDSRSQATHANVTGVLPTQDVPQLDELIEANVQLKHRYAEKGFVYGDVSLFGQFAGNYRSVDADGHVIVVPDHHVPANDPLVSLSELYVSHDLKDEWNFLVGKKRIVWGPGFSFNPTDLINPPKDPTDPTFQRAGAWMGRVEWTLPKYTFTLLGSPAVTEQTNGLPYAFLYYPKWDRKDDQAHYQLAARAYALIADSDVNLMLFYGNRYADADPVRDRLRAGASFSRVFFTDYEVHAEALFQRGTSRTYANGACVSDVGALFECLAQKIPLQSRSRINDHTFFPRVLGGVRKQFEDESMLSVEYLYQSDGFTRAEFEQFVRVLAFASRANPTAVSGAAQSATQNNDVGVPQKFTFLPLVKHYAFITFQKPRIHDDWTVSATLIENLQDLSGMITPALSWQPEEWLQLTMTLFVPFPGPAELAATIPAVNVPQLGIDSSEQLVTEYGLLPFDFRAVLSVRAYY